MKISAPIVVLALSLSSPLMAVTSNWTGPGSDFNTAGNWSAGVPVDDAGFNNAAPMSILISIDSPVNSFTFNPGAAAYTLTTSNLHNLDFNGTGIINNSGTTQTLANEGGHMLFANSATINDHTALINSGGGSIAYVNSATAGDATVNNVNGSITFLDSASAANSSISNLGSSGISFLNTSTAGNATIDNSASLAFRNLSTAGNATITNNSAATIDLQDFASLSNATVINNGLLNASNLTSAAWSAGSLSGSGRVQLGSGGFTVGSNNLSTVFSGVIVGTGGLFKIGTGSLTLSGANTFTGTTSISQGTLHLTGSLTSNAILGAGGTLSGTGSLMNIVNNGTVAPGVGGIGTLTATQYAGTGILSSGFEGAPHGAINISGIANINGGTLNLTGSRFAVGHYSVLHANSVSGTFATFNTPASSLLTFAQDYTATDAFVTIDFATPFLPFAQNTNQRSVAANLNGTKSTSTGDYTEAINDIAQLPASQIPNAYSQISGDSLASFQVVGLQNAAMFSRGMRDRSLMSVSTNTYGLWSQAVGWIDSMKADSSLGSPASRATTGGFQAGYDTPLADGLLFGFSGGYSATDLTVDDRSSSGQSKTLGYGVYLGYAQEPWFANGGAALTRGSNDMTRPLQFVGIDEHANAKFHSSQYTTYVEGGYSLQRSKSLWIEPSLSLRHTYLTQDSFTETGAPGLNLTMADQSLISFVSSLGVGLRRLFQETSAHPFTLSARLDWDHEFGQTHDALSAHFAETSGGTDFTVEGTPRPRDAAVIGLEGRVPLRDNLELFGSYAATVASVQMTQKLFGGARFKW